MTLQLVEGQDFAVDFSLLQRVSQREGVQQWVALDRQLGERVLLKVFDEPLDNTLRTATAQAISTTRGLVHPNIARVHALATNDGIDFIVSQLVRGATPFDAGPLDRTWPLFEQLFSALTYAHSLGLAHGHLHPGNLLVDDRGNLYITDFALPSPLQHDEAWAAYLSPQVKNGSARDLTDDIFSLGQLLYVALCGSTGAAGATTLESTRPIPAPLRQLVLDMLKENHWERPRDLAHIRELAQGYARGEAETPIEPVGAFRRAPASSAGAGTDGTAGVSQGTTRAHTNPRDRQVIPAGAAFGGFALLMMIAVAVFYLLPESGLTEPTGAPAGSTATAQTVAPSSTPTSAPAESPPALTPLEQARQQQLEADGEQVTRELLRLQVNLEDAGVQIWGQQDFSRATALTSQADEAYRNNLFDDALALYGEAKAMLEQLQEEMPAIEEENRQAGEAALAARDAAAAIRAFTIVTAINPTDAAAKKQLARAENLEQLLTVLAESRFLESEGNLDDALQKINEALALDSTWQPALDTRRQLTNKIATRAFNAAMSAGLAALADENFAGARGAFNRAATLLPASSEPADGLQQVEVALAQRRIRELQAEAVAAEADADWPAATSAFEALLAMDPTLVFAASGLARVQQRQDLDNRLQRFLDQPTLMASDDELSDARAALAEAARISSPPDRLKKQLNDLSVHISLARIKVPVEIQSDQRTDVTVYRIGNLGKLDSTTLPLVPGRYTIVGKRRGYRDVEVELTLLGGRPPPPVLVACTEKI